MARAKGPSLQKMQRVSDTPVPFNLYPVPFIFPSTLYPIPLIFTCTLYPVPLLNHPHMVQGAVAMPKPRIVLKGGGDIFLGLADRLRHIKAPGQSAGDSG